MMRSLILSVLGVLFLHCPGLAQVNIDLSREAEELGSSVAKNHPPRLIEIPSSKYELKLSDQSSQAVLINLGRLRNASVYGIAYSRSQ